MINTDKLFKYVIMFVVVTLSAYTIPTCGVMQKHAVYVGLIASSTYAMIDKCYPHYIIRKDNNDSFIKEIY